MNRMMYRGVFAALLLAMGTGCPDDDTSSLVIASPTGDLTYEDDVDTTTDGVQFDVTVSAANVDVGTAITLYLETIGAEPLLSGTVDEDGMATFRVDAGEGGTYNLTACTEACRVQSASVPVVVTGPGCASLAFVSPTAPSTGTLLLGESDSNTGSCDSFTYDFQIATSAEDGTEAQIFVNDVPQTTVSASGNVFDFADVQLSNSRDVANTVTIQQVDAPGCPAVAFPATITVDCEGVQCEIASPSFTGGYLNGDDDTSEEAGFQAEFGVQTDSDVANVTLTVDGVDVDAEPDGTGLALFSSVDLSEGRHTITTRCVDTAGNVGSSSATFQVDTVACGIAFDSPDADTLFIDEDDVNDAVDGTQIAVAGTATGTDCVSAEVALDCTSAGETATLTDGAVTGEITLSSSAEDQPLCMRVTDSAGNVGEVERNVRFRSDAPVVEFLSPAAGVTTAYSIDGGTDVLADLDVSTSACEADIVVTCSDEGVDVVLTRTDTMANLAIVPCSGGMATFSSVALPSVGTAASAYNLRASQTNDRLTGTSAVTTVYPDCVAPTLLLAQPTSGVCAGGFLRPSTDDVVPGGEFDYDFRVINSSTPQDDVTLTLTPDTGSPITVTQTTATGLTYVLRATMPGGSYSGVACATDVAGNTGCTDTCSFTVADVPSLTVSSPTDGAILGASDDCDAAGAGFIAVAGTTDASDSATVTATVGSNSAETLTLSSGVISGCVAPDGEGAQTVLISVDDPTRGTVTRTVTVTVDTLAPTGAIDLAFDSFTDRRGGIARLGWTDGADADGTSALDSYEIRCSAAEITDESSWTAATVVAMGVPAAVGSLRTEDVSGFALGTTQYCAIRAADVAGQWTPVGADVEVTPPLLTSAITGTDGTSFGIEIAGIGDVNGDSQDDIAVLTSSSVIIYAGGTLPLTEIATITGVGGSFSLSIAALGDINGDGLDDFVVGDTNAAMFSGTAYLFCGGGPAVTAGGNAAAQCDAQIDAPVAFAAWGTGVGAVGDVNGDGAPDVGVGGTYAGGLPGMTYVLFSDSSWCRPTAGASVPTVVASATADGFTFTDSAQSQQGRVIIGVGDLNGDGFDDFASMSQGAGGTGSALNIIQVPDYGAATGPIDVTIAGTVTTFAPPTGVWTYAATVGDLDGDGYRDLAAGAADDNRVRVFFGSATGFSASATKDITADGTALTSDAFGRRIAIGYHPVFGRRGNLLGGTAMTLAIASRQTGTAVGATSLFFGTDRVDAVRSDADLTISATGTERTTVQFIGDIDGDGANDLARADFQASPPTLTIVY